MVECIFILAINHSLSIGWIVAKGGWGWGEGDQGWSTICSVGCWYFVLAWHDILQKMVHMNVDFFGADWHKNTKSLKIPWNHPRYPILAPFCILKKTWDPKNVAWRSHKRCLTIPKKTPINSPADLYSFIQSIVRYVFWDIKKIPENMHAWLVCWSVLHTSTFFFYYILYL